METKFIIASFSDGQNNEHIAYINGGNNPMK
jgi:hypothetical protein